MNRRLLISLALSGLGVGLIIMGFVRGEDGIMFNKAINICLECIGIG